jgi:hypothetical protein
MSQYGYMAITQKGHAKGILGHQSMNRRVASQPSTSRYEIGEGGSLIVLRGDWTGLSLEFRTNAGLRPPSTACRR